MSTATAGFLQRYEAALGRLPGDSALRAAAAAAFKTSGLPGATQHARRIEAWKYTSLRPVAETTFRPSPQHEAETLLSSLPLLNAPRIVFVDGTLREDLSDATTRTGPTATAPTGPTATTPTNPTATAPTGPTATAPTGPTVAARTGPTVMAGEGPPSTPSAPATQTTHARTATLNVTRFADQPDFGTLTWPDREPMVALNTMLATDGAVLNVPADADGGTIQLVSLSGEGDFHPRHTIRLEKGARLTVVEISAGQGTYLLNTVAEIHVAAGAHLTHIRLQDEARDAFHVSTTYADIQAGGTYDSFTLNLGARLSRTEVHAELSGPGAVTHLNAAQILAGAQHSDFTTVVSHTAPSCSSRQTVKNVLADRARGVFQGKIEVARDAQKTDGYQMNQALLLSPYAEVDSKPELEIFADDVKCSHGATVGELDAEQMFYLRSRGIPDAEARSILVRAFLAEALDAVADETIRGLLETAVEQWWERQKA